MSFVTDWAMPVDKLNKTFDRPLIAFYRGGARSCFDPRDFAYSQGDRLFFVASEANRGLIPKHALMKTNLVVLDLEHSILEFRSTLGQFPLEVSDIDLTNYEVWWFRENFQRCTRWERFLSLFQREKEEMING